MLSSIQPYIRIKGVGWRGGVLTIQRRIKVGPHFPSLILNGVDHGEPSWPGLLNLSFFTCSCWFNIQPISLLSITECAE